MSSTDEKVDYNEKTVTKPVDSDVDSEANVAPVFGNDTLHRSMKNRHIAMIRYVSCALLYTPL